MDASGSSNERADLGIAPPDAFGALVIHPHRLLSSPQAEWLPLEIIQDACARNGNFDPLGLELVIAYLQPLGEGLAELDATVVLRFRKPIDRTAFPAGGVNSAQKFDVNGHTIWLPSSEVSLSFSYLDERTVVLSSPKGIRRVFSEPAKDTSLSKQIAAADQNADIAVCLPVGRQMPMISAFLPQLVMSLPNEFRTLPKIVELIESADVEFFPRATEKQDSEITLRFTTRNNDDAITLAKLLRQQVQEAELMLMRQARNDFIIHDRDELSAITSYLNRVGNKVNRALQPETDGNNVSVRITVQEGNGLLSMSAIAMRLGPAIEAGRAAADRNARTRAEQVHPAVYEHPEKDANQNPHTAEPATYQFSSSPQRKAPEKAIQKSASPAESFGKSLGL